MADKIPLKLTTGPNEIREFEAGDTVIKGNLPSDTVYFSATQTLNNKNFGNSTGCTSLRYASETAPVTLALDGVTTPGATADHVKVINSVGSGATISAHHTLNPNVDLKLQAKGSGNVYVQTNGIAVGTTGTQTLENKTLDTPTIPSFANATHNHTNAAGGGALSATAITSGSFSQDRIADVANRSGSYAFGRGSAVLVDNGTAAGLGGNAVWAQRPRVLQVVPNAPGVAGISATPVSTLQTLSAYNTTLSTSSGVSLNVTPDCLVDSTGGPTPTITAGALNGKLFRVTVNGQFQTSAAGARTITISSRFINSATVTASVSWPTSSIVAANFYVSFLFSCTTAQNVTGFVIPIVEKYYAFTTTGVLIAPQSVGTNTYASMTLLNNSSLTLDVQVQMTGAAASGFDNINLLNVFYEALN